MTAKFVHEQFFEIAATHPEWIAIKSHNAALTYGAVARRAGSIAERLREAGARRGSRVVIFAENRVHVIECLIGVLSSGAAVVPIVPATPPKRIAAMLAECDPDFAVVEPAFIEMFSAAIQPRLIPIISDQPAGDMLAEASVWNCAREQLGPDDLMYLVFTSGSTGTPKAIAGRRESVDHFIKWEIETFGIGPGCHVSQLFSPMFDAFLRDVFAPLCSGATLCIPATPEMAFDGVTLARWLDKERITHVHTVPSILRMMMEQAGDQDQWSGLRYILLAGEPLLPSDVSKWYALRGKSSGQLVNLYGPSETTMTKFVYLVCESDQARRTIPIGKPMPGAKAVPVDDMGKICKPRTVGEIYIRTPYRSLGYFGRPELTAEAFIPNPFSKDSNDIVYKTGDLGRVLEDGNFELIGRRDHQVKIRGVRIELSEIEAIISKHQAISSAVVTTYQERSDMQLIAYLVNRPGVEQVDTNELRNWMREWLPLHSIPSAFIWLEQLPLTPNGKVDRKRLPQPTNIARTSRAARDGEEELLCGIFAQVLKRDLINIDDNFFDLGGHSLLAAQMAARIRSAFCVELPLRALFDLPTPAGLLPYIRLARENAQPPLGEIETSASSKEPVLSHAQQRLWFISQVAPDSAAYNLAFGLRLKGSLNREAFRRALGEIMRRHDVFRASFPARDGAPVVQIARHADLAIQLVDLRELSADRGEAEARRIAHGDAERPFDLSRCPLLRVRLIWLRDSEFVLYVTAHHIICDAWSTHVFVRELGVLYDAFIEGKPSPLTKLPLQYVDAAAWERSWLTEDVLNRHLEYWRKRLEGCSETIQLPADFPRPAAQSFRGAAEILVLPVEVTCELRAIAREAGATEFMLMLALMNIWLHTYSGQSDLIVGTPVSNRNRLEAEDLIGLFVNTIVLRSEFRPEVSFREFLRVVRDNALEAYAHQFAPFERIVDELGITRTANQVPLFQVMLNIENAPSPLLYLSGLEVEPLTTNFVRSRVDLHLGVRPRAEELELILIYNADLFRPTTVASMLSALAELAGFAAREPESNLGDLAARLKRRQQANLMQRKRVRSRELMRSLLARSREE